MTRPVRYPLTVFYDASCPTCASEMHGLRDHLDAKDRLVLVDCSAARFDDAFLTGDGLTRADLMHRMHARDATGRWFIGVDALEVVYRAAGLERAARLWGNPAMRPLLDRLYAWIARNRRRLPRLETNALVRRALLKKRPVLDANLSHNRKS